MLSLAEKFEIALRLAPFITFYIGVLWERSRHVEPSERLGGINTSKRTKTRLRRF